MRLEVKTKHGRIDFMQTVRALKAARLTKGLSRKDAAKLLGWTPRSFEQLENGRCNFSEERLQRIIQAYGYTEEEFRQILWNAKGVLAKACQEGKKDNSVERKPRRNHYKIVTKEVRAIRILRKKKGISQYQASRLCGYVPGGFGHIEVGRIELRKDRITHILRCLGYIWKDFEDIINAPVLRDEIIEDTIRDINHLDDQSLLTASNLIKALIK
jgi:transcriptional regulator with XRE-family HTH domain